MITKASMRKNPDKWCLHMKRLMEELLPVEEGEADDYCNSMKAYVSVHKMDMFGFQPEENAAGYFFLNQYSDIREWHKNKFNMRSVFKRERKIKKAWKLRHRAKLDQIEKEVWGDLVSKYPDRIWGW